MKKRMTDQATRQALLTTDELVELIRPMLHDKDPETIGATLAQLVALFFAGHSPAFRERGMVMFIELVNDLIPIEIDGMIQHGKVPPEWKGRRLS